MRRRGFLKSSLASSVLYTTGQYPFSAYAEYELINLTILHTNDVHSRIEPFPMDGSRNQGLGGVARRASLLRQIRKENKNVLLLDAGDIFQGTPYFNFFGGELEFKLMSEMDYAAATIGNHDFDAGLENLAKQMDHASFKMLNCNYGFDNTPMKGLTKPYQIYTYGDVKIGVLGLGIEMDGLVAKELYGETQYFDPIDRANKAAKMLKEDLGCDYVVCLSHLGNKYNSDRIGDHKLAAHSRNIDLIIGGHTHTFMKEPVQLKNLDGERVLVNQVGWAGILLGRIDLTFERNKKNKCVSCNNLTVG